MAKVTFSLDHGTVRRLQEAAERLSLPKSEVVREAICEFHERIGRLSESERLHLLKMLDEMLPAIPARPVRQVDLELKAIRRARHAGGRRTATRTRS